ncbi:CotH kinase family protein [Niabella drilacis]|uniref:CotH protein n=1 Tax=Niabella drilacis (strain DSM 25811 / CCM 8410 / CCUG 62505 / LMG 26954 / E90) TaxID=1285928 RepID=A0A1G6NJQ5_NIADE|nr:CotH kinase family protein [Niabella drilacis]SDC67536.1 CotH protein [Niabella drilacis]
MKTKGFYGLHYAVCFSILLSVFIHTGCRKKEGPPAVPVIPVLEHFTIEKKNNPDLEADIAFSIKGDSVIATQPYRYKKMLVPSFATNAQGVFIGAVKQESGATAVDFSAVQTYTVISNDGTRKSYYVKIAWVADSLPHLYIQTEGGVPVASKDDYVNATLQIDGRGKYADFTGATRIKGRGNTTWSYPKKPYRLKLNSSASLLGLATEKDWVLLANYLDPTLMLNAVAMKIGAQLQLPYTNHIIPVNITLNGRYLGCYNLTEQVEVGDNRVKVGSDGLLLELDSYFDEPYKFRSANYSLPVMIKEPELSAAADVLPIQTAFNSMESLLADPVFPANNYREKIDVESVAKFMLVYFLTDNEELNHPKSTYMHKTATGKYTMGPIWDFDWAFGFEKDGAHLLTSNSLPFWTGRTPVPAGTKFFTRFLNDPQFVTLLKQLWTDYKSNHLDELVRFVETYGLSIMTAKAADYTVWKKGASDNQTEVTKLQQWLRNRASYIDGYLGSLK